MVFIVKIPNRSRANTPETTTTPSAETPMSSATGGAYLEARTPPHLPASNDAAVQSSGSTEHEGVASTSTDKDTRASSTTLPQRAAAELDVLLAPSVLNHRYVRGVDKSLIVERPERIRAVLLGIATAIGKSTVEQPANSTPPLPAPASSTFSAAQPQSEATSSSISTVPSTNDDDDLVSRLNSLSVQNQATTQTQQRFRVLHSTRSLPLDPPHPAVAFAHAHSDELVTVLESAYDQAKQRRRDAHLQNSSEMKGEREATPTPSSLAATTPAAEVERTSHAAYLEYLCRRAPNQPPLSQPKPTHNSPSKAAASDSEAYTSSDGEGDLAMHPSEVPDHLPQGDLYLAGPSEGSGEEGGSSEAIRHAMGACCEAVDRVVAASSSTTTPPLTEITHEERDQGEAAPAPAKRGFVLSRPPGHHCSGSTPQGFCWVNNAIVASAHAYLTHSIDRVVIFDIDLHHGNGTQNLVWRINSDANKHDAARSERIAALRSAALDRARSALHSRRHGKVVLSEEEERKIEDEAGKRGLRIFYGSLHDIESFPCEDGDAGMIKDASVCVEGAHGQWIWNVHLDHHSSEREFLSLYHSSYSILFQKAARFLRSTASNPSSTLILISAGFDACSYEYPGMQRHGKHVPPSFYHLFARDSVAFADQHSQGKLVSVLEGGYSDRALCSAALAHVTGLAGEAEGDEGEWWKLENLIAVEKVAKKMAAAAAGVEGTPRRRQAELPPWLNTTSKAFAAFERACGKNVVALTPSAGGGSGGGRGAGAVVDSPSLGVGAGRVLRTRKSRAAFEQVSKGRGVQTSPTKASPSKKASPTKARASAPNAVPVTPVKSEDAQMETETPTRTSASDLPNAPLQQDIPQPSLEVQTPIRTSAPLAQPSIQQDTPQPQTTMFTPPQSAPATSWISHQPAFAYSNLQQPATPRTATAAQDLLSLHYGAAAAEEEKDAPASPDPDAPQQQHRMAMPGDLTSALAAFSSMSLDKQDSPPKTEHEAQPGASLYPTLPPAGQFRSPPRPGPQL